MKEKTKDTKIIFDKINEELSSDYKGKIVAIDIDSGDYFIGDSAIRAYEEAIKKYPKKKFLFKRIGFSSTYVVGALWLKVTLDTGAQQ